MKRFPLSRTLTVLVIMMTPPGVSAASPKLDRDGIMAQLRLDADGRTEVVKQFPASFPEALIDRGQPLVYTRSNSNDFEYIGMPVGGIGAGMLYLGGDGQLWFWDIFNLNYKNGDLKGEESYQFPYTRSRPDEKGAREIQQGFALTVKSGEQVITRRLDRDGFEAIEFLGQYPIGEVNYRDPALPVTVHLEAFSPFIPLDIENSILPATVLRFTLTNTSDQAIETELTGWLENAVLTGTRGDPAMVEGAGLKNRLTRLPGRGLRMECLALAGGSAQREAFRHLPDHGTMTLTVLGEDHNVFSPDDDFRELPLPSDEKLVGTIGRRLHLAVHGQAEVVFLLTWHFPNTRIWFNKWRVPITRQEFTRRDTHYYASKFRDALAVADGLLSRLASLSAQTRLWRDTWYDSTLPYWFLDRTFLNTSILASCTSKILDGFIFHGTEGSYQGPGTCNHVWGYVHAMGRLFPSLEKSLRENMDFRLEEDGGAMLPDGRIRFRWLSEYGMAVDGQAGTILRTCLTHQMSPDDAFLRSVYPHMKMAMQGLMETNDPDHDGILTGPQHNTLDASWYGKVTWLSLHYGAALRAAAAMADDMGDHEYADFCRDIADKGRRYIEEHLFNGEYFFHEADPDHPDSPGVYTGLEYSQLLGQSWAYQVGLGPILDPDKVRTALESMWRYNFTTDVGLFREAHPAGRWYAMPGEGGLIACTWPRGGSEVLAKGNQRFAAYNNECQNGYEYAATSLMMWHGMPWHALAHIWYMHNDRYHGAKRNPWNEIEWGMHYARSMASYGHFVAVCGFEYNGPRGYMAFSPKITPEHFRAAFTAAEGWGTFEQNRDDDAQHESLTLKHGRLLLRELAFDVELPGVTRCRVSIDDRPVQTNWKREGKRVTVRFDEPVDLTAGQNLECVFLR